MIETPVLIVGAGPVGLALACDLGLRGIPCLVLERGQGIVEHPKATAINARSMEFMRRWGIAEEVRAAASSEDAPQAALYCTTLSGYEIARIGRPSHGGAGRSSTHSPERAQRCNQLFLDPILVNLAKRMDNVTIRYRCHVESASDVDGRVVAIVHDRDLDVRFNVTAEYLVDCSGGRSNIRRSLGIEMEGSDYVGYFLSIFVRAPDLWKHVPLKAAALVTFVDPKGFWRHLIGLDGRELFRLQLNGRRFYDAPAEVNAIEMFREVVGADVPFEIMSTRRWIARNLVADRYRSGRIFLAGDAAHLNHPAAGLGLNTGLGDAVDLGWKIAAMLNGWGGPHLLDSYETERRPVGLRNVRHAETSHRNEVTQSTPPEIAMATAAGAAARSSMQEELLRVQTGRVLTEGLALGYRYSPSPIVCLEGEAPPEGSASEYQPSTLPGERAPHAWLADGESTLDLFNGGFTLLRLGEHAPSTQTLEDAFAARQVPLKTRVVEDPAIHDLYERALILVRPDGHVAWRSDTLPSSPGGLVDRVRGAFTTTL